MAGVATSVIVVNQHTITGKNFEFSSHYLMPATFFFFFFIAYVVCTFFEKKLAGRKIIAVFIIVTSFSFVLFNFRDYAKNLVRPNDNELKNYAEELAVVGWLNKNSKKDDVIYAPADLSLLIPIYTPNNVYFAVPARLYFVPQQEILDRFVLNNYFAKFDRDFVIRNFRSIYGVYYTDLAAHLIQENKIRSILELAPKSAQPFPTEAINTVLARKKELAGKSFARELVRYRVDYLVFNKRANYSSFFDSAGFLKRVWDGGDYAIYAISAPKS